MLNVVEDANSKKIRNSEVRKPECHQTIAVKIRRLSSQRKPAHEPSSKGSLHRRAPLNSLPSVPRESVGAPAIIPKPYHESRPLIRGSQGLKEVGDSGIGDLIVSKVGLRTVQASIELGAEVVDGVVDLV